MIDPRVLKVIRRLLFYFPIVFIVTVGLFIALVIYGVSQWGEAEEPRALPPMYHNAQQITQQDNIDWINRLISFHTTDRPEVVRAYYSDFMKKAGWWTFDSSKPDTLGFRYETPEEQTKYSVQISINETADSLTNVEITMDASKRMGLSNWPAEND